jgi:hypothetical protein
MKLHIFILIEFIFLLMLALIIYNAEVRNNLELSLGLNKIIFIVSIIKLLYLAYSFNNKMTMCQLSNKLFC